MRIISLLPSATEMICLLGLRAQLVGVSHECDFPPQVSQLPRVTRSRLGIVESSGDIDRAVRDHVNAGMALYELDLDLLASLSPDLIVTQSLCGVCAVAEGDVREAASRLPQRPMVLNLEPANLAGVFDGILQLGELAGIATRAADEVAALQQRIASVRRHVAPCRPPPQVVLLEWLDPLFSSGHWNPELVAIAGGNDPLGVAGSRSRSIEWLDLLESQPDCLVIACCGFDVATALRDMHLLESHPRWMDLPCARSGRVFVVDGSAYFNRPGPRLVDSLEILAHLIHPQAVPAPVAPGWLQYGLPSI